MRIAIADDHQIFRDGLKRLLESEPGFQVVAECADGADAVRVVREVQPDVLLLDIAMPRMNGIDALSLPEVQSTKVIVLTAAIEPSDLLRAVQYGTRGVVLKESATRHLIDGIHRVMDGKFLFGAEIADDLALAVRHVGSNQDKPYGLTARELDIVTAIEIGRAHV